MEASGDEMHVGRESIGRASHIHRGGLRYATVYEGRLRLCGVHPNLSRESIAAPRRASGSWEWEVIVPRFGGHVKDAPRACKDW